MNLQATILGPVAGLIGGIALLLLCFLVSRDRDNLTKYIPAVGVLALISIALRVYQLIFPG